AARGERHHLVREMRVAISSLAMAQSSDCLNYSVLRLGLSRVHDVVGFDDIAEMRMILLAIFGRDPDIVSVGIAIELAVSEVASQQPELPHQIRDVLANVSDGSVRPNDDLLIFLGNMRCTDVNAINWFDFHQQIIARSSGSRSVALLCELCALLCNLCG